MKRFIKLFLIGLLIGAAAAVPAQAASSPAVKEHDHILGDPVIEKAPTCYKGGWRYFYCTDPECGYYEREAIPATGHDLDEGVFIRKPTCAEFGSIRYTCRNEGCGYSTTRLVSYTGHRLELEELIQEPSCTDWGIKRYTCAYCGYTELIYFPSLGHWHDEGTVTRAATCTMGGVVTYSCLRDGCEHSRTAQIPALPHDYDEGTVTVAPTATSYGRRSCTCQSCGKTMNLSIVPTSAKVTVYLSNTDAYTVSCSQNPTVPVDGKLNFTVTPCEGYILGEDFAVTADRATVTKENDGSFTLSSFENITHVTIAGIEKAKK